MKKHTFLKTFVVILMAIIILSLTSCFVDYEDDYIYASFTFDGEDTLKKVDVDGTVTEYELRFELLNTCVLGDAYAYSSPVEIDDYYHSVFSTSKNSPILYVETYEGIVYVFVGKGANIATGHLDRFESGEYTTFATADFKWDRQSLLSATEATTFFTAPKDENIIEFDVRDLEDLFYMDVIGYDESRFLAKEIGGLYKDNSDYYFINYEDLDNSYFDANGNFSYRKGKVNAEKLVGEKHTIIENLRGRVIDISYEYEWEEGLYVGEEIEEEDELAPEGARAILSVVIVLLGIILPLAPIAFVVIRILTNKRRAAVTGQKQKHTPIAYFVMVGGAALWLLAAIALLFIVIFG